MNKKGQALNQLQSLIMPLVGICIVLTVGFMIMAQVKTQIVTLSGNNSEHNASLSDNYGDAINGTRAVQSAMDDIPGWLPIIIITVIGAILLALVAMFRQRGQ